MRETRLPLNEAELFVELTVLLDNYVQAKREVVDVLTKKDAIGLEILNGMGKIHECLTDHTSSPEMAEVLLGLAERFEEVFNEANNAQEIYERRSNYG